MKRACLILTIVCLPTAVFAQPGSNSDISYGHDFHVTPSLPSDYGHSQHHCSTAGEGQMRGWAAAAHAQGNYLVNVQQARILAQKARTLDLLNDRSLIELHNQKQTRRVEQLAAKRQRNEATRSERYYRAFKLSAEQLETETGKIHWPGALQDEKYSGTRRVLDALFEAHVGYKAPQRNVALEIDRQCQTLIREFQRNENEMSRSEYIAVMRFLRGLKYEPLFDTQVN